MKLGDRLQAAPHAFDGLHAVRTAELCAAPSARGVLGTSTAAGAEGLRLSAAQGLAFAPSEAVSLTGGAAGKVLRIAFMGLTGPLGVLPQFYSEIVQRADRLRDAGLSAFLDLFNHRLASLFVRASEKYRSGLLLQRAATTNRAAGAGALSGAPDSTDPVSAAMLAIAGFGTPSLRGRLSVPDDVVLYYAGLFAGRNRPASALQAMLADYLGVPVRVQQFSGRWVPVSPDEQTRLTRPGLPQRFGALGVDTVAGARIWDVAGNFRVIVGPVGRAALRSLMPDQDGLRRLVDLVRVFAGPDLGFDVQIILSRGEVPDLALAAPGAPDAPRLGWNTWAQGLPALADKDDVILGPDVVMQGADRATHMELTPQCA